jgi:hypothetical protein
MSFPASIFSPLHVELHANASERVAAQNDPVPRANANDFADGSIMRLTPK